MNDIKLIRSSDNTFDWNFKYNDVENVFGVQQLVSAVIHTIFLYPNELSLYLYSDKGCEINNLELINPTTQNLIFIQEIIKSSCKGINGVRDAEATVTTDEDEINLNVTIKLITNDGQEVIIDGI